MFVVIVVFDDQWKEIFCMWFKCFECFLQFQEVIEDLMFVIIFGVFIVGDFVVCVNFYLFNENFNSVCFDFIVVMDI